jgi:hypothetical protein
MKELPQLACGLEGGFIEWVSDFCKDGKKDELQVKIARTLSQVFHDTVINQFLFLSLSAFLAFPSTTASRILASSRLGIAARGCSSERRATGQSTLRGTARE